MDLLLFCLTVLLLSVLFTAHHLCLYYLFQPYSESLQIKVGGFAFTMAALAFTTLYTMRALALVYHRTPKSFRVK